MTERYGDVPGINLFNHFMGPEIPIATDVAYGTTAGGCNYYLGDFGVWGDLAETDTGVSKVSKENGYVRVSNNNENGKGVFIGTYLNLTPSYNGPITIICGLERAAVTAGVVFVGLMGTHADDVAEPVTSTTTTITKVATTAGFILDSQLTAGTYWHMPYLLTGDTTQTSTDVVSTVVAVAAETDDLKLVVYPSGYVEWWINGKLEQSAASAIATTTKMSAGVGCWGTTTTAATVDVDYLGVRAAAYRER